MSQIINAPAPKDILLHIASSRVEIENSSSIHSVRYSYQKISVFHNGKYYFIPIKSIALLKADGSYTHIYLTDGRCFISSKTLKQVAKEVKHIQFIRCHQSYIINENHISRIDLKTYRICVNQHIIPVSRSYRHKTLNRLQSSSLSFI